MSRRGAVRRRMTLTPLEVAVGFVLGKGDGMPLPTETSLGPLEALEAALVPLLQRPPCLVSFSGGRDSSAVLAVAVRAARRHGLDDPIPATIRVPTAHAADESAWQERVVGHVGVGDWLRLEFTDELDVVGPIARTVLDRHGLLWPFNAHFHVPMLDAARGGSLLTGIGGDELFAGATSPRPAAVLAGRARPVARDLRRIALYTSPQVVRRWWYQRRALPLPWLNAAGLDAASAAFAAQDAAEPRRLATRLAWLRRSRALARGPAALALLAAEREVAISHPLLDRRLWAAIARASPPGGYLGRAHAMRSLFGDLLPDRVLARADKALFDEVFFARHSRAFATMWPGQGAPAEFVDADRLREHWAQPHPRAQSFTLLQAAYLESGVKPFEHERGRVGERVEAPGAAESPHWK